MLVTAFTCSTLRNERGSCRKPIQTPSSQPTATRDLPSMVTEWSVASLEWIATGTASGLTERTATGHSASESRVPVGPGRSIIWCHVECIQTQGCHLEDPPGVVHFIPKYFGVLQLLLPFSPSSIGIGPESVLATELALSDERNGEGPDCARIGRSFRWTIGLVLVGPKQSLPAARSGSVREIAKAQ